jgi:hypothetical protein
MQTISQSEQSTHDTSASPIVFLVLIFLLAFPMLLFSLIGAIFYLATTILFIIFCIKGMRRTLSIIGLCFSGILLIISSVIAMGGLIVNNGSSTSANIISHPLATPKPVVASLTVKQVFDAYTENEVRANSDYKGNIIAVTGTIYDISSTSNGGAKINLRYDDSWNNVSCVFSNSDDVKKIATMSKGDTITVKGRCDGKSLWEVFLKDCTLD